MRVYVLVTYIFHFQKINPWILFGMIMEDHWIKNKESLGKDVEKKT